MAYRGYGGGGGRYTSSPGVTLSFPPFTYAVKWLIIANTVVYFAMLLLGAFSPGAAARVRAITFLSPVAVVHGWIWQLLTYSFQHLDIFHILFNMLTLWMFGAILEGGWRHRKFFEFYFYCVVGAALTTIGVSYLATTSVFAFLGVGPATATAGASGGIYGVMVAVAVLYGDQVFTLFPIPISIKAKYLVAILVLISLASAMGGSRGSAVAYFAHLGGALFGWIYVRFLPSRGLAFASSEGMYGIRNRYQQWKRRRMARKFEVYMRRQDRDRSIDHFGRPDERKKDDEDRPPWVN